MTQSRTFITESVNAQAQLKANIEWHLACKVMDVPPEGGVCVKLQDMQVALFYLARRNEWYATQNMCPHRRQMALSRGMTGSNNGEPKVACPFHKKTFSLRTGECLNGDECSLETYPVKVEGEWVFIGLKQDNNQHTQGTHLVGG